MYGGLSPQQRWSLLHSLPDFLPSVSFPVKIISCKEWFDVEFHVRSSSRDRSVTFHRLPLRDPERLQLWLITLRLDLSSSVESPPRAGHMCDEHFSQKDYQNAWQENRKTEAHICELELEHFKPEGCF